MLKIVAAAATSAAALAASTLFAGIVLSTAADAQTVAPIKAPSVCKGRDQPACGTIATCKWHPAITAGETNPRTSRAYVATRKAHCRPAPKARAS